MPAGKRAATGPAQRSICLSPPKTRNPATDLLAGGAAGFSPGPAAPQIPARGRRRGGGPGNRAQFFHRAKAALTSRPPRHPARPGPGRGLESLQGLRPAIAPPNLSFPLTQFLGAVSALWKARALFFMRARAREGRQLKW